MARNEKFKKEEKRDELIKKTVSVNRVTKTVKGGRNMRFAALVVVGDGKNRVGCGLGKAKEVPDAIEKATEAAKKAMITISIVNQTIPHTIQGQFGRGKVLLMPATEGTGVIAGGPVRAVVETVGIKDIRSKALRSNNPCNVVRATINGLAQLRNADEVAAIRGKNVKDI